jgi:pyridoxamine 5'-phosphate oxidase
LEQLVEETTRRFEGVEVPRPPYWGGFLLRPIAFEFWQGRPSRLHDRFHYTLANATWGVERLAP